MIFPQITEWVSKEGHHRGLTEMGDRVPEYVTRQRAAAELCMSDDTFDRYVREGVLPSPKRRGKLMRWKWSEIVSVLDGGAASSLQWHETTSSEELIVRKKPTLELPSMCIVS